MFIYRGMYKYYFDLNNCKIVILIFCNNEYNLLKYIEYIFYVRVRFYMY